MAEQLVKSATVSEIFAEAEAPVRKVLDEIFVAIHPRLGEQKTSLESIFTPDSANEFLTRLTDFEALLAADDSYDQTLQKFQAQIDGAEQVRDEVLARLFEQLRPLEASYRQVWLFFENTVVPDGKQRKPVEFFVMNASPQAMRDRESVTLEAVRRFIKSRNDNFNFRDDICNLVVPGELVPGGSIELSMMVREALEEEAWKWGMLLVTDLGDEESFKRVVDSFRPGGRYEFLKRPDNKAASDVVMVGTLKLRDAHWFEKGDDLQPGLYAPASMAFAGALARTDRARDSVVQGPIGTDFGQIKGIEKARIECLISEMELLSQQMQVIPIIRDADNHLCFYGCRSLADDPYGVYKFFTSYRVLAYLERSIAPYLRQVAGLVLSRDMVNDKVEAPIKRLLEQQISDGTILHYDLFVDKDYDKLMQGVCDVYLEVMPAGPAEVFRIKIDVPDLKPLGKEPPKGPAGN